MTASFGTPYVSGVVALMLDANPALTLAQVREILRTTAQDWGPAGQDVDYGWGRLDAHAAVKRAGNFTEGSPPPVPGHVSFAGTLSSGKAEHTFAVSDVSYPLAVTLIMPGWSGSNSPDFEKTETKMHHLFCLAHREESTYGGGRINAAEYLELLIETRSICPGQ